MTPSNHTSPADTGCPECNRDRRKARSLGKPTDTEPQRIGDVPAARLLRVLADRIDQGLTPPRDIFFNASSVAELSWHDVPENNLATVQSWIDLFQCEPPSFLAFKGNRWTVWHGSLAGGGIAVKVIAHHPDTADGGEPR